MRAPEGPGLRAQARRWAPLIALFALIAAAVLVGGPPAEGGPPLDPRSTAPLGTKALADILRELGADVRIAATPDEGAEGTALVLVDVLDDAQRDDLRDWVRAGGTLVVADPHSTLAPRPVGFADIGPVSGTIAKDCDLAALRGVERVAAPGAAVLEAPPGAVACFPRGEGYWLVAADDQAGALVALGGPEALVNVNLGSADNALLAAALLAPRPGAAVTILRPPLPGEGQATLADLVPSRVRLALLQLAIAFALVASWRARRLGRPVEEVQPVEIPGSELVAAVGHLLQQTKARGRAAALLRDSVRDTLAERLGLPARTSSEGVADAAAERSGVSAARVRGLLAGGEPADDAALVRLAQEAEQIRRRALAVSGAAPGALTIDSTDRSTREGVAGVN